MESSKPSGAQQPQLPAAGAQRRRQHLSWPRLMRRCHARQWLAAELQPAHEPRRRQSAAVRARARSSGGGSEELRPRQSAHFLQTGILAALNRAQHHPDSMRPRRHCSSSPAFGTPQTMSIERGDRGYAIPALGATH
eukprot:scaffold71258_cov36-Phaeocystis_antarctica.AAC.1